MAISNLSGGYQTGDPSAIARRYSSGSALASNLGQIQRARGTATPTPSPIFSPPQDSMGPPAPDGFAPAPSTGDDQTMQNAAAFSAGGGVVPPEGNAAQRWPKAASDSTSRYYTRMAGVTDPDQIQNSTTRGGRRVQSMMARHIYAGSSDVPNVTGANNLRGSSDPNRPAPVQFNNSPSGWEPY